MPRRWIQEPILVAEWLVKTYRDDARFMPPSDWWLAMDFHKEHGEKTLRLLESLGRKPAASESPDMPLSEGRTE